MAAPKGNKNATKGARVLHAIERALADTDGTAAEGLHQVCLALVRKAKDGEQWAVQEVLNRFGGKPTEHVVADVTHRVMDQLSDDELLEIIRAGSSGTSASSEAAGPDEPAGVH